MENNIPLIITFQPTVDRFSGVIAWISDLHPAIIYATPFFEDETGGIPIDSESFNELIKFPNGDIQVWQKVNLELIEKEHSRQWRLYLEIMHDNMQRILRKIANT